MWLHIHNLRLGTRLMLGFLVIIAITTTLSLFQLVTLQRFSQKIAALNISAAQQVGGANRMFSSYLDTQQAINAYLLNPDVDNTKTARDALDQLEQQLSNEKALAKEANQQQRLKVISGEIDNYHTAFRELSGLVIQQSSNRLHLFVQTERANGTMRLSLQTYLAQPNHDPALYDQLIQTQARLQASEGWVGRLLIEEQAKYSSQAISELSAAQTALTALISKISGSPRDFANSALEQIQEINDGFAKYIILRNNVEAKRSQLLELHGKNLERQINLLAADALSDLNDTTTQLNQQSSQAQQLMIITLLGSFFLAITLGILLARMITRPLREFAAATLHINQGNYDLTLQHKGKNEISQLAIAFNHMIFALKQQRKETKQQQQLLAKQNTELQEVVEALQWETNARHSLETTVRTMSVPVIPILANTLLLPLVGEIDQERADLLLRQLLKGVEEHRARTIIIDITGVPLIDQAVADTLLTASQAARLLGAESILVGVGPEVAQTLVSVGIDLKGLQVWPDLRSAIAYSLKTGPKRAK